MSLDTKLSPIHEVDVTRAASQGPAALAKSACEPADLGVCFTSPFRLVCGCHCRSAWQRHPPRYMARARCLMARWRGRCIRHCCCKSRELHARGCCNKSVACEPLDHHIRQIGTPGPRPPHPTYLHKTNSHHSSANGHQQRA